MTTNLQVGDRFPDFQLPNHQNELMQLSQFTQPSQLDRKLGFFDGYPLSTETEIITQPFKNIPRLQQISPIEGCVIIYSHPLI